MTIRYRGMFYKVLRRWGFFYVKNSEKYNNSPIFLKHSEVLGSIIAEIGENHVILKIPLYGIAKRVDAPSKLEALLKNMFLEDLL